MKASQFQFRRPRILDISYKVNTDFEPKKQKLSLRYDSETLVKRSTDDRFAEVIFTLKIFDFKHEDFSNAPFALSISVSGEFQWTEEIDERVDVLLRSNAPAVLLSYIRPFVAQFTAFSGYPPLILPLIDFTKNEITKND